MSAYQPKTGQRCTCKRGVQRDNCPRCEGTGMGTGLFLHLKKLMKNLIVISDLNRELLTGEDWLVIGPCCWGRSPSLPCALTNATDYNENPPIG